ncbi:hypothetical protein [Streptomyces sp. SS]|uniref:hypothetical protein n=1 Tax=Streptomyces sp. SS TaxID=260742 RepID=UPI000FFC18E3|nr:hypothetical protein [Streptomyces sp. SS]
MNVFARGDDHVVYQNGLNAGQFNGGWSGWKGLYGLNTTLGPATTVQDGSVYVFAQNNSRIYYTRWNGTGADGWQEVPGGQLTDFTPGVAPGVIVARQANGGIRYNTFDGSGPVLTWYHWRDVPDQGRTPSAPAITKYGNGYFLFVRDYYSGIQYKSLNANRATWGVWTTVPGGGKTPDAPAVASELLAVRGTDDRLHWNVFNGWSHWTGWNTVGGKTYSAPALTHAGGFYALVVRGTDDGIHYMFYD